MSSNYFFSAIDESLITSNNSLSMFLNNLKNYSLDQKNHIFVIQAPLANNKYIYTYKDVVIVLIAKKKIAFINFGDTDSFETFREDFIEDLNAISDKYEYKSKIGRPRDWKTIFKNFSLDELVSNDIQNFVKNIEISSEREQRLSELIISLLTGSINDIEKIDGLNIQDNILDKIKKKIILFDSNQTNFLYQNKNQKKIIIQGLSGTGKTELLLHKLKELYLESDNNRIFFTCNNKILAESLRNRIPRFFNFMQVSQQIDWDNRLWCNHAWGSGKNKNSGLYSFICHFYGIPFLNYAQESSFSKICSMAIEQIKSNSDNLNKYAFDYILIDESQDFGESFFELCSLVTKHKIYIAGDIFQSIFGEQKIYDHVDYLLNQCYRTDPKTLMFSHGLSMGLFESEKLQWLTDQQWEQYGYIFQKNNNRYIFTREPIRRFEDLKDNDNSIHIENIKELNNSQISDKIVELIMDIKSKYPSAQPDDIAIIFLEQNRRYNSEMLNYIRYTLEEKGIDWPINPAFESKQQLTGYLSITNFNHVKGLEFPFVICISPYEVTADLRKRNAIYMAMTRSFLHSSLLMPVSTDNFFLYSRGLNEINSTKRMTIEEPNEENKNRIREINIQFDGSHSFKDIVIEILDSFPKSSSITDKDREWCIQGVLRSLGETYDKNAIKSHLKPLIDYIQGERNES
ncbi:TPA: DEAD/DEAH box helicase family protein [Neisseria meningitidis]